jgi:hypothetical protein
VLALSLQGKYDEAKVTAGRDLPDDKAAANVDYVRSIVNLEAKPLMTGALSKPQDKETSSDEGASGWTTKVAASKASR